jgi:hypothetical protein
MAVSTTEKPPGTDSRNLAFGEIEHHLARGAGPMSPGPCIQPGSTIAAQKSGCSADETLDFAVGEDLAPVIVARVLLAPRHRLVDGAFRDH